LADLPLLLPSGEVERLPVSAADVVRRLADNGCWMVLWFLERSPAYRMLLDDCLDQVRPTVVSVEGAMGQGGANLLVASPCGTVPVHFDRHHNLLLQVRGTKRLMVGTFQDPAAAQHEIERHYGASRNLDVMPTNVTTFELGPGDGVYIPPYAFHWVIGGPDVSVALSCGFRSPQSERAELVYRCNVKLRRVGLSPSPPGRSEWADRAKAAAVLARSRVRTAPWAKPVEAVRGRLRAAAPANK
jgi:hypothetical protein